MLILDVLKCYRVHVDFILEVPFQQGLLIISNGSQIRGNGVLRLVKAARVQAPSPLLVLQVIAGRDSLALWQSSPVDTSPLGTI